MSTYLWMVGFSPLSSYAEGLFLYKIINSLKRELLVST